MGEALSQVRSSYDTRVCSLHPPLLHLCATMHARNYHAHGTLEGALHRSGNTFDGLPCIGISHVGRALSSRRNNCLDTVNVTRVLRG